VLLVWMLGLIRLGFLISITIRKKFYKSAVAYSKPPNIQKQGHPWRYPDQRRRLYRKTQKVAGVRAILKDHHLPIEKHIALIATDLSPWQLRADALTRRLDDREFARVLVHFAKRAGFESNRKSAPSNEDGPLIAGSKALASAMIEQGYDTIGSYLNSLPKQRNDPESYGRTVLRDDLRAELQRIFQKQRMLGNEKATQDLLNAVQDKAFFRKDPPSSLRLVGNCTLEPTQKRAPKRAYHAELFVALSRLTSLRITTRGGGKRILSAEDIQRLEQQAHTSPKVTFAQARKLLSLSEDETFNLASYRKIKEGDNTWEAIRTQAEKATLIELTGFHEMRKALSKLSKIDWASLAQKPDVLDQIAFALSFFEAEDQIRTQLDGLPLDEAQIIALLGISSAFSKTIDLSLKAVKQLIPLMREGQTYGELAPVLFPDSVAKKGTAHLLPPLAQSTRNPIVDRALSQIRKVVNALIRTHGMPDHFYIETGRELGNNWKKRKDIERDNKKREQFKKDTYAHATEIFGREPNGEELAKFRLWKEQNHFCFYSGERIAPALLTEGTQTQIDHILPYSRSFDDSWSNKTLCLARENQRKKNETAYEYMDRKGELHILEDFANTQEPARTKKLLLADFDEEKQKSWKSRHMNDTRYVARALSAYLEENLQAKDGIKKLVQTRTGGLTAKLRHLWGLPNKDRKNDHRHHGVDALVIACSTQSMVQKVARWSRYERGQKDGSDFYAAVPWPHFREDAMAKIDAMFVTRQPARKTGGRLHEDTIKRLKQHEDGAWQAIKRVKVLDLKPADLANLVDVTIIDGTPTGRNAALYQVLKDRLEAHGGDGKKAFSDPIYMPTGPNAKEKPQIRRVRLYDKSKSGFPVRQGIADNAEMAWTEVYEKGGKFYLLPIYTHHVATKNWPNRLITANKEERHWDELSDHRYLFSLFKNDYVVLESKKGEITEGFYKGTDRANGSISFEEHKGAQTYRSGVKMMKAIRKYDIDLFGNRTEVRGGSPWRGDQS